MVDPDQKLVVVKAPYGALFDIVVTAKTVRERRKLSPNAADCTSERVTPFVHRGAAVRNQKHGNSSRDQIVIQEREALTDSLAGGGVAANRMAIAKDVEVKAYASKMIPILSKELHPAEECVRPPAHTWPDDWRT